MDCVNVDLLSILKPNGSKINRNTSGLLRNMTARVVWVGGSAGTIAVSHSRVH